MTFTHITNIRGPKGEKGEKGDPGSMTLEGAQPTITVDADTVTIGGKVLPTVGTVMRQSYSHIDDLDNATAGTVHSFRSATANTPVDGSGVAITSGVGNATALQQTAFVYGIKPQIWMRYTGTIGWSAWQRVDAGAVPEPPAPPAPASPRGFRTVPLALTVGGSTSAWSGTSGGIRLPVQFGATITRWRVHFRNINPREGAPQPATVTIGGVRFGRAGGSPHLYAQNPLIAQNLTGSGDLVTPWQTTEIPANAPHLLGFNWTATAAPRTVVGGGWTTEPGGSAYGANVAPVTPTTSMPLDVWIEAEAAPDVPIVAAFGDSISSGVGATQPVYDSWLSQYCRKIGALPVHYTASGDSMAGWSDPAHYKWTRWEHLSRPDAIVHAMGSNDVFGGAGLATMQERYTTTMGILRTLTPNVYGAKVLPRTSASGEMEDVRRAFNTWLPQTEARDVFDFVTPVSADDERLADSDTTDGTHLTTLGYQKLANAITRPVVPAKAAE